MKISRSELLETIIRGLVEEFSPEQIYLFGSQAWGEPGDGSDWDLLVIVANSDLSPTQRAAKAFRRLFDVPVPLDILVKTRAEVEKYRSVHASLTAQILERGKVLYG